MKVALLVTFLFFCLSSPSQAALPPCTSLLKEDLSQVTHELSVDLAKGYSLPSNYTTGYYARRIEPYLAKPTYAEVVHPQTLYRGMFLTPQELEKILTEGMKLDRVKWTAADGGISFSSNINEAATYIFQSADTRPSGIGVVFEVKTSPSMELVNDPILNSTRTIFKKHADVTKEEILNVYIWGQWGLENLKDIAEKMKNGKILPHETWSGIFDQTFLR